MKKILMLYYTVNDNYGDVLIYNTAKKIFMNQQYEVYYTEVGRPCNQLLVEANQYDFLLFAGGGIIERNIVNVIRNFKEDYFMLKVPYGVMGLSIGEFDYSDYTEELKFFVENASFFYVRDEFTKNYFNNICKNELVDYSADIVFSYDGINRFIKDEKDCKIGINIRNVPYIDLTGDIDWVKMDNIIMKNNIDLLIPDESDVYEEKLKNIKINLSLKNKYKFSESYEKTQIILNEISKCKIVIAMRFHVILTTALCGKIPIPITYCPKCSRLASQLGIEELSLDISEIDKIEEKIEYAKRNENYILNKIRDNINIMQLKNEKMFREIFEKIKEVIN